MISYDSLPLQVIETGAGFLKAIVTFAVPGVLPYVYGNGIRMEAKLPQDVLSPETIDSANGVPVVDGHPYGADGQAIPVTPENYQELTKGTLSGAHVEVSQAYPEGCGRGIITIYDSELIDDVLSGKKTEVSMGFDHDDDPTPGQYSGNKYDSAQKNIRVNHLAIVEHARAGDRTKINLYGVDSMDTKSGDGKPYIFRKLDDNGKLVKEITVDSKEVLDEMVEMAKRIKSDGDALVAAKEKLSTTAATKPDEEGEASKVALLKQIEEHEAKEAELMEQLKAWQEQFEQLKNDLPGQVEAAAGERMDAIENVKSVDCGAKVDGLSTQDLKKLFIEKVYGGSIKTDGLQSVAINAKYEAAKEYAKLRAIQFAPKSSATPESMKADTDAIAEKRNRLTNYYEYNKERK